jgi:hypothetical protein
VFAVPALIAIFWGAPLIAAEIERGSHRMTWNQSITPVRRRAVKLAILTLATLLTATCFWRIRRHRDQKRTGLASPEIRF